MELAHVHVYCQELEPAIRFFTEGLGGELIVKRNMMGDPGAEIRLSQTPLFVREVGKDWAPQDCDAEVCGYSHFGFLVDDLDTTLKRLLTLPDVRQQGEPFDIPARKRRCVYLTGPSGLYIELVEDVK